jgi:hypothetical protein
MAKFHITFKKVEKFYGYEVIEADTEAEARELAEEILGNGEIEWSDAFQESDTTFSLGPPVSDDVPHTYSKEGWNL